MHQHAFTLSRHIIEQQRKLSKATGRFSELMMQIAVAAKVVSAQVNRAGLIDMIGLTGEKNVYDEEVKKLDQFAQKCFYRALDHMGLLCVLASEESEDIILIPDQFPCGPYVFCFDPIDGSGNIDVGVTVGTIFSIQHKISPGERGTREDCLQPGKNQVCAGYIVYGSSTMLVYTAGAGVYGFTLDPTVGEFLLSHEDIRIPTTDSKNIFSVNMGNYRYWDEPTQRYIDHLMGLGPEEITPYSMRYIGSLIADFHRNLLYGGIFLYPLDHKKDAKKPKAKLRLLFEASPLALIAEQAGGSASTGTERILDIQPTDIHQRVPLIIGSRQEVELYEHYLREGKRT